MGHLTQLHLDHHFKGSRSHLQISLNIMKLCKDENIMMNNDVYEIL